MDGIWLLKGPEVQPGLRLEGARIVDLAPTLLHMLGVPVPTDMDGAVMRAAFVPESPLTRPERREGAAWTGRAEDGGYSSSEEEEISRRLVDLGYVA